MSTRNKRLAEDGAAMPAPTMSAGSGQIAGIGVGPQGEPGANMAIRKKKWKQEKQKSKPVHVPTEMISGGLTEGQKPLDMELWQTAQLMAKSEYPHHPTPESTKFAIAWYLEHGGEYVSNTAKNEETQPLDAPTPSVEEIAKKHGVSVDDIHAQLTQGIQIEREHTSDDETAEKIALDHLSERPDYYTRLKKVEDATMTAEDLRKWFGSGKTGGIGGGGWDRYNTKGDRIGKCGDAEDRGGEGEGKPKCLSKQKAAQLRSQGGKQAIANAVKRKKSQDPVTDRKGTGGAPRPVSNRIGESVLAEKNVPTNPELWSRAKSEAKKRFDVYPSAYANGWAAKWYKEKGGGWKSESNEDNTPADREWGTDSLVNIYKKDTPGQLDELFTELVAVSEAWEKITKCQQCKSPLSSREQKLGFRICDKCIKRNKSAVWGKDSDDDYVDEDCGCGTKSFKEALTQDPLTECIGVTMKLEDKVILAKNRDRAYRPDLEVVHGLINGTEVAFLHDITTDWSEGMNEHGIGIVNTALFVGYDEDEKKIIKDKGKKSKDGARIRYALSKNTIDDVVQAVASAGGGVKGHTIVSSPDAIYTVELTSRHKAHIIKHKPGTMIVRTNHGDEYPDAGYTQADEPDDYKSSVTRREDAIILLKNATQVKDVLPALRTQLHGPHSNLDVFRDTNKMNTSSQLLLNLTDRVLQLDYVDTQVDTMRGVRNLLPKGYDAKIRINIQSVDSPVAEDVRWYDSYVEESEYQGRKVTLGKPFRTPDGPKKFSVYVKNDKGNVVKVNFGDPKMDIKRDDPARRKNYRARHGCDNPGPRWKANYWSCRFWSKKPVSKLT